MKITRNTDPFVIRRLLRDWRALRIYRVEYDGRLAGFVVSNVTSTSSPLWTAYDSGLGLVRTGFGTRAAAAEALAPQPAL